MPIAVSTPRPPITIGSVPTTREATRLIQMLRAPRQQQARRPPLRQWVQALLPPA